MSVATVLTGVVAGLAGGALTALLHLVQHVAFGYSRNSFLIGVKHAGYRRRVLAVGLGGGLSGLGWWAHRRRVDPARVSVTGALRLRRAWLPVIATVSDAGLQVLAVGVGASLGREGAPRQSGAALGGWVAARLAVTDAQQRTLLACGAGAGLAAVYNVPLGGAAFTVEILLASLAFGDLLPALLSSAVATVVAWPVVHNRPTYPIPPVHLSSPVLVWAVLLGPLAGLFGVCFSRLMTTARRHAPGGWRTAVAVPVVFTGLGAAAISYPQLLGNGKGPASLAFDGTLSLAVAGALLVLKPLATAACLSSGAIGGLLTPALATGAALGVCTGRLWSLLWPGAPITQYAIVGAAALLAATQRAPLTAIVLTIEFIGGGAALLAPITLAVALALAAGSLMGRQPTLVLVAAVRRHRSDATVSSAAVTRRSGGDAQ